MYQGRKGQKNKGENVSRSKRPGAGVTALSLIAIYADDQWRPETNNLSVKIF